MLVKLYNSRGKHKRISEWQTPTITKPEIRIEKTLSCLIKWMHSVCYKATEEYQQSIIFINVTA